MNENLIDLVELILNKRRVKSTKQVEKILLFFINQRVQRNGNKNARKEDHEKDNHDFRHRLFYIVKLVVRLFNHLS